MPEAPAKTAPRKAPRDTHCECGGRLLDLRFPKLDMLARNGIVFALGHLLRRRAAVLLGDVKEAGVGRRQELDLDGRGLGHGRASVSAVGWASLAAAIATGARKLARDIKTIPGMSSPCPGSGHMRWQLRRAPAAIASPCETCRRA